MQIKKRILFVIVLKTHFFCLSFARCKTFAFGHSSRIKRILTVWSFILRSECSFFLYQFFKIIFDACQFILHILKEIFIVTWFTLFLGRVRPLYLVRYSDIILKRMSLLTSVGHTRIVLKFLIFHFKLLISAYSSASINLIYKHNFLSLIFFHIKI